MRERPSSVQHNARFLGPWRGKAMGRRARSCSHASHETGAHLLPYINGGRVPTPRHSATRRASERMPSLAPASASHFTFASGDFTSCFSTHTTTMLDTNVMSNVNADLLLGKSSYSDVESEINAAIAERAITKASEYRKVIKPLLEKRRRARINHCLTELKDLLLETYKADISEPSKLEKADILELTVRHLRELRRHQRLFGARPAPVSPVSPVATAAADTDEYRAGFAECVHEVSACLPSLPGLDVASRSRLMAHLSKCLKSGATHRGDGVARPATALSPVMLHHPLSLTPPPSPVARCNSPQQQQLLLQQQQQQQQQQHSVSFNTHAPTRYPCETPTSYVSSPPPCREPEARPMDLARAEPQRLPTGYVSLAVLMSHKMSEKTTTSPVPVWRPW